MQRRQFLQHLARLMVVGAGGASLSGCDTMEALGTVGESLGQTLGAGDQGRFSDFMRYGSAVARAAEDLDPEQEYYLGRTVTAQVLSRYPPYQPAAANDYISAVGRYVSLFSTQPETFGGYHFQIIDTDEINALSAPGGMITVSRGLLRCCHSEDAVAAVLAHEIGHVQARHGVQAIRQSRRADIIAMAGSDVLGRQGGGQLQQLVGLLDGAIEDILTTMINNGYSQTLEFEADRAAVQMLRQAGYDDRALLAMLDEMGRRLQPGARDFAHTHPSPAERMRRVESQVARRPAATHAGRQARFRRALAQV